MDRGRIRRSWHPRHGLHNGVCDGGEACPDALPSPARKSVSDMTEPKACDGTQGKALHAVSRSGALMRPLGG